MAHKKGQGTSSNGRDSRSQRLGVKLFGGEKVLAGGIIIRQRGSKHHAGKGHRERRNTCGSIHVRILLLQASA